MSKISLGKSSYFSKVTPVVQKNRRITVIVFLSTLQSTALLLKSFRLQFHCYTLLPLRHWMSVARRRWPGRSCDLHLTSATKLTSMLGHDHRGGLPLCTTRARRGAFQLARGSTDRFRLLLRRYPHQSSTRPHTVLHTRPTHSPSQEFRLHSHNHLQEFRLKFPISFQELRLDSRLRAFGSCVLRPLRLTPSRVRTLPHPRSWFYITYLLRYNTTQHVFLPCAGFNPPDFLLFFVFPVALRPTCVMLSPTRRYISSPVAFDWMTLSAYLLSRVQTQITHSLSRNQTRLIIPSHEIRVDWREE